MCSVLRFLQICLFLLCVMVALVFLLHNTEQVSLDLLFWGFAPQNSGVWMLASFSAGVLIGFSGGILALLTAQRRRSRKRREQAKLGR